VTGGLGPHTARSQPPGDAGRRVDTAELTPSAARVCYLTDRHLPGAVRDRPDWKAPNASPDLALAAWQRVIAVDLNGVFHRAVAASSHSSCMRPPKDVEPVGDYMVGGDGRSRVAQ
jgi:hypothetical protein